MAAPTSAVQKLQKILANVGPSTHGLSRIILAAPEAFILRTQTREGTMRFCRTFGEPWRGSASLAACGPPLSYLPMQPALLFAATLLPLLAGSNTVGTSLQTPDRFNLDRIGSKKKRGQRGHEQERNDPANVRRGLAEAWNFGAT